jgi:CRP-like cAMP-binding protein
MKKEFDITSFTNNLKDNCIHTKIRKFSKGEVITTYLLNRKQVCIILSGAAYLVRYDNKGHQNIIYHYKKNDIFGEIFHRISTNRELFVLAKEDCEVLFFPYSIINTKCNKNCAFHDELLTNFPSLILNEIVDLNSRVELLSKRSIRDKLIAYFKILSKENYSNTFTLPLSLTDLADFLIVDRAAMMRELKKLMDDHIIEKKNKKITLLYK